ncbi:MULTISPECIES: gephyrin-like molybdotransferase Glp [unclassified Rhodococcus (in: high G+C Gram-positive bacteria)]|uniref:molybdopterin molybdotransferase MoeA n=1 Tax=unclassified Rhodococcus (in: high G+C Gram-positive bacteria) TaxID=192944 RepID=UPI0009E8F129|nr:MULTISPECIES: gephyrin-like molybdotransferase Glp [unclassified Rhodococcus (in: high G+C Gram-positive bacteria)]
MGHAHTTSARSVEDHAVRIDEMITRAWSARPPETVPLTDALGRVTHADIEALIDVPNFRNSQMDGYAVDAESVARVPVTLPVTGVLAAGDAGDERHRSGTARKIMTGAPVPEGADAVIPVEDTEMDGDGVRVLGSRRSGEYVREQGSDIAAGSVVVPAGTTLGPRHLGALTAVGRSDVTVRPRLRVAVIATGAELVEAGSALGPGQLYDSNGLTLTTSVTADGAVVTFRGRSTDTADEFSAMLSEAAENADVIITSGGVSMGDFEVVRDVLGPRGGTFTHVAMQPGGPQGWTDLDGTPVISFPGNPVSTLVSYLVFARPAIRRLSGLPDATVTERIADVAVRSLPGRRQFLRGRLTETGVVVSSGPGSHLVVSMAAADVLVDVPADTVEVPAGNSVRVWPL